MKKLKKIRPAPKSELYLIHIGEPDIELIQVVENLERLNDLISDIRAGGREDSEIHCYKAVPIPVPER